MGNFLVLGALAVALLGQGAYGRYKEDLDSYLQLVTSVKFGDSCSWTDEEFRRNYSKILREDDINDSRAFKALDFMDKIVSNNIKLCSTFDLLVCDKVTEKCVCGDPSVSSFRTNKAPDTFYVTETGKNGIPQCKWTEGTYCTSPDIMTTTLGLPENTFKGQCEEYSVCIGKSGERCSMHTLTSYILSGQIRRQHLTQTKIMEDFFNGEICSCQIVDKQLAEFYQDNQVFQNDPRRTKRGAQERMLEADPDSQILAPIAGLHAIFR